MKRGIFGDFSEFYAAILFLSSLLFFFDRILKNFF